MLHTCTWRKPKCYIHMYIYTEEAKMLHTCTWKKPKCYIQMYMYTEETKMLHPCTQKKPKCYIHVHGRSQNVTDMLLYMEEAIGHR